MGIDYTVTIYAGFQIDYTSVVESAAVKQEFGDDFDLTDDGKIKEYIDEHNLRKVLENAGLGIRVTRFSDQSQYHATTYDPDDESIIVYIDHGSDSSVNGIAHLFGGPYSDALKKQLVDAANLLSDGDWTNTSIQYFATGEMW